MAPVQVLIVGGGPTGSLLALALAQNGISVRVIEKLDVPSDAQRGAGSQPRTLEFYKFLGVLDDVFSAGRFIMDVKQYDYEGNIISIKPFTTEDTTPTPSKPFRRNFVIGQEKICRVLADHLKKRDVNIEYSSELVSLTEHEDYVVAKVKKSDGGVDNIETKFVVGADGARGVVRKLLGLKFLGETTDVACWAIGDLKISGLDKEYWHIFGSTPNDTVILAPTKRAMIEDVYWFSASGPTLDVDKAIDDYDYLREYIHKVAKHPDLKILEVKTLRSYRPNNTRVVETFKRGRVFVAGDAAHIHSFTGGQGLNSGVGDSFNLGWKLALVLKGLAPQSLLDTYTEERLPVIQHMLQITSSLLKETLDPNRKEDETVLARPSIIQQLGINYRSSSIVLDQFQDAETAKNTVTSAYEVDDVLRAGVRAPQAPGLWDVRESRGTTFFDMFRPTLHTVLIFEAEGDDGIAAATVDLLSRMEKDLVQTVLVTSDGQAALSKGIRANIVVEDREGHAADGYSVIKGESRVVVVRPDSYVGAIVRGAEGLRQYFSTLFVAF